jgi:predicted alpha/beta superfamily hydrolase
MGERYYINVGLPSGYKPEATQKYPLLVVTDGDWVFRGVNEGVTNLDGVTKPVIVVSIGTAEADGRLAWGRRRIYEFSPSWELNDPFGQEVAKVCKQIQSPEGKCVGGQERFLRVIVSELIPLITAKYPIDTTDLGLFGVSAGGYFVSWVIFQPSSPFRKYLISSPAMAYGDEQIFRVEAEYARTHKDLAASIYMASGGLETSDNFLEGIGRIVSGMSHFAGVLAGRKYPGLTVTTEYHPGMGHGDVMGTSVSRGMRVLYPK